ncbi:hypothetical protein NQ314_001442 [Rhamnusium bicolor]|uniref:Uncharacterized protein n=1 Tax=Rhamnusium bicolor TaxID=1586634 RepID=A0AAV8ZTM9_9CUCU|nr:hypothetical protein NQ314_001442 [Rhamnusium bicolor]
MGNIGSQTGHISHRTVPEEQWAHSFPRTQPSKLHQNKVLPERDARQTLRPTNNGQILHSGGTLTGRQHKLPLEKSNQYHSHGYNEHSPPVKTYFSNERDPLHKSRSQGVPHRINQNTSQKALQEQHEKLEWEENSSDNDFPIRKTRLFKTRAETKKNSSHVNKLSSIEYTENSNSSPKQQPYTNLRSNRLSLPELKLAHSDDFQKELKEATKRLRHIKVDIKNTVKYEPNDTNQTTDKIKLKTLDYDKKNIENFRRQIEGKEEMDNNKNIIINNCVRGEASGKESSTPENSPNLVMKDIKGREQPKTFYFGMDEPIRNNHIDHFTSNLHQMSKIPNSSESDISSDMDSDENNISKIGIDLQLRPILPKKTIGNTQILPCSSDDVPVFIEERIEKYSRPPPPSVQVGPRSSNDKSGDSGISGDDAIPTACYDDHPENEMIIPGSTTSHFNRQERISWTPQQDLGDDSSIEDCTNNKSVVQKPKTTYSGPHLFSVLNNLSSNKKDFIQANLTDEESVNWFLSKSAPNSLSNGFHSLEVRKSQDSDHMYPPAVNKTSRVMYLPETESNISSNGVEINIREKEKSRGADLSNKYKLSVHSKSCEDINIQVIRSPEILQDPPVHENVQWKKKRLSDKLSREAERREKKRLRELEAMQKVEEEFQKKRAREKATIRQQLRLYCMDEDPAWSSLPPNLEIKDEIRPEPDGAISSSTTSSSPLPVTKSDNKHFQKYKCLDRKINENKIKASATQELSEYRQTQRDYKEYRGNMKYTSEGRFP